MRRATAGWLRAGVVGLLVLWPVLAGGQVATDVRTADTACAPKAELAAKLDQRLSQLTDTRDRLRLFAAGQDLSGVPPAALFTVDLSDQDAVQRRVKALAAAAGTTPSAETAELARCAGGDPDLQAQIDRLGQLGREIDRLRLAFLSLPRERRDAVVSAQKMLQQHTESIAQLEAERATAQQQQQEALRSIEAAEEQAKTAASADRRELATQRALLEKTLEELAAAKVQLTTGLQERTLSYQKTAESLSLLAGALARQQTPERLAIAYEEVAAVWRDLVDKIFERIADPRRYEPLPRLPTLPGALLARLGADEEAAQYQQTYRLAQERYDALKQLRAQRFERERESLYRLLLQAGRLRSALLQQSVAHGDRRPLQLSEQYFADVVREIRIVPYHALALFYAKALDLRQKADSGLAGWVAIANQVVLFAAVAAVPFLVFYALRRFADRLNRIRRELVRNQGQRRHARTLAIWIRRLTPYVPWAAMLLGVWLVGRMLARTAFAEAAAILPYVAYYLWYRVFLNLISSAVGLVAYSDTLQAAAAKTGRIHSSARRIVLFFVVALAILHAAEDVVGKALVYRLVFDFMLYAGAIVCFAAAREWRREIAAAAKLRLPGAVADRLDRRCSGLLAWLVCLPTLLLVIAGIAVSQFRAWAGEYDFFKRLGAELFRRRIAGASDQDKAKAGAREQAPRVPKDYLDWFDLDAPTDPALLVEPDNGVMEDIRAAVDAWLQDGAGEHALALYGDKGSGKSSLLRVVEKEWDFCRILRVVVPPRLYGRDDVLRFFAEQLGIDLLQGVEPLLQADAELEKTLVLVDEAHNLFLATPGGFDGYRAFMDLVNAPSRNLFWCVAFNRRSWNYLAGVFAGGESFHNAIEVPPLSDETIERLILARHQRTSYDLAYDAIIRATQVSDEVGAANRVEAQFFRLLWGQSRGNPRAAIVLWTGALTALPSGRLKVGVPRFQPVKSLEHLGDDAWFVYAAVLRHENLSADEAVVATHLRAPVVRDALRNGVESHAIARGADGRYRVTPEAQTYLTQLLLGKNFIHE